MSETQESETQEKRRMVLVLDAGENEHARCATLEAAHAIQENLRFVTTTVCTRCADEDASDPHYLCADCTREQ